MEQHSKPVAYSYARFSTRGKQERGSSLERQLADAKAYCERMGFELADATFQDLGLSGFHGKHLKEGGALKLFLAKAESGLLGESCHLICENVDRLSRLEPLEGLNKVISKLLEAGVTIHTTMDGMVYTPKDANKAEKLLILIMQLIRSRNESEYKSVRVKAAWKSRFDKAKDGKAIGGRMPFWIDLIDNKYTINPKGKEIIELIYSLAESGLGPKSIAVHLNKNNIPVLTRRKNKKLLNGKPLYDVATIKYYLSSQSIIGFYQPTMKTDKGKRVNYGEPIKLYPPIISEDRYWKLQANKVKRGIGPATEGDAARGNIFGSVLLHYPDNASIRLIQKVDKDRLICSSFALLGKYKTITFPYNDLESEILDYITSKMAINFMRMAKKSNGQNDYSTDLEVIQEKLKAIQRVIDSGKGSFDRLYAAQADLEAEEKSIMESINKQKATSDESIVDGLVEVGKLINGKTYADRSKLKSMISSIIKNIYIKFAPHSMLHRRIYLAIEFKDSMVWLMKIEKQRGKAAKSQACKALFGKFEVSDIEQAEDYLLAEVKEVELHLA